MEKKKGFITEFKEFISRGNVIDMAVGVIVGSAFTTIVNSLVKDIVTPAISMITGKISFADLKYVITPEDVENGVTESAIYFGTFIENIINFLIIAFVVFCFVKLINGMRSKAEALKKKEEEVKAEEPAPEAPPAPSEEVLLLQEIRDLLKKEENK